METLKTVLIVIHLLMSVAIIALVLMQQSKGRGMSGAISGGSDTFFGKHGGRTVDSMLKRWTVFMAVVFLITSITLSLVLK